jgi:preprotein translocase subunit SecB
LEEKELLKEYLYSRHRVQLVETTLVEAHLEKFEDEISGQYENLLDLKQKVEIENEKYYGYLKVEVELQNIETKRASYKIMLIYKGLFKGDEDEQSMKKFIKNQVVAQLYPFARGAIATMSAFMNIPLIVIPTIDVIGSLEKNEDRESES